MPRNKRIKNILRGGEELEEGGDAPAGEGEGGGLNPAIIIVGVIGLIIVIVIVVMIVKKMKKKKNEPFLIGEPVSGTKPQMVLASQIPISTSHEYSMNFWIFVRDWSYNYGNPKCILYRGDPNCNHASPMVFLYPTTNSLMVRFSTEADRNISINPFKCGASTESSEPINPFSCNQKNMFDPSHSCDVTNIPIQRWVQVSIVLWNTNTDVYINGKLARSCTHPSIPLMMNDANIYTCQGGGFNGYISKLQYFNYAIDALKSYKLYLKGPIPKSLLGIKLKGLCGGSDDDDDGTSDNSTPDPNAFKYGDSESCS